MFGTQHGSFGQTSSEDLLWSVLREWSGAYKHPESYIKASHAVDSVYQFVQATITAPNGQ